MPGMNERIEFEVKFYWIFVMGFRQLQAFDLILHDLIILIHSVWIYSLNSISHSKTLLD